MGKSITITPNSGVDASDPQVQFQGDDTFTAVDMNAVSGTFHGSVKNVTSILFEGSQGTLFSVDDNLSSGTIFSVSDVTGLPLIEANASGDVKLAEYGREVLCYQPILISGGAPSTTTDRLYNDNGTLKFSGNTILAGAAQTAITSMLATDLKIGEDDQTKIDFETADTINFYAGNEKQLILTDGALTPGANAIIDLGTDALEFKDGYFDGTLEADAITIGGTNVVTGSLITTLGTISAGVWQGTAIATTYIADNAITLAKLAGGTDGQIITFDANGDPVAVGPGTDGQVLTSTGAGSPPAFEDASGGGGGMTSFILEDDSGDEVSISDAEEVKFIGDGITINWTDVTPGSDADPFDLTFTLDTVSVANGGTNATSLADKAVLITQDSGTDTVAAAVIDANGELLIGGTSGPAVATLTQGSNMTITNADGAITLAAAGAGISDQILKDNVITLSTNGLDIIDQLNPVEFDWNQVAFDEHNGKTGHDFGLIAQEVEQTLPEVVSLWRDHKAVDYAKLTVILIKAVQELKQEVEDLKST